MLKRLYIDNFRCFVNFEWKPDRKQLLLGANGSGKSSLLDAIRALKSFVCTGGPETHYQKEFHSNKTRWLNLPKQIFEIEAEIGGESYIYRLENEVGHSSGFASVASESLRVSKIPVVEVVNGTATLYPTPDSGSSAKFGVSNMSSVLTVLSASRKETSAFVTWLREQLFCLRINPDAMRSVGQFDNQTHPDSYLSDIASWYLQIAGTDVESVIHLRSSLQEALNGFDLLQLAGQQGGTAEMRAIFKSSGKPMQLSLTELSEGQRCLIALYMILHLLIEKGYSVLLDEPENFISLREIQPWLLAAEDAVRESKGQLLLVSHHPEILNYWAKEFGLLFVREENGHVRTKAYGEAQDTGLEPAETIARGWEDE